MKDMHPDREDTYTQAYILTRKHKHTHTHRVLQTGIIYTHTHTRTHTHTYLKKSLTFHLFT